MRVTFRDFSAAESKKFRLNQIKIDKKNGIKRGILNEIISLKLKAKSYLNILPMKSVHQSKKNV